MSAPEPSMDPADLLCLLRDTYGVAPGDARPRALDAVDAPPWTRPLARFMWDRMWSWANALRGQARSVDVTFVPVWTALAEEVWDRRWEPQVLAVEDAETFRVLAEPTRPLACPVSFSLEIAEDAAVVMLERMSNRVGDAHVRIGRRMGPYGVICRVQSVRMLGEPTILGGGEIPTPELVLDPWTQVMHPRGDLDRLQPDRRMAVERVIAALTDDGPLQGPEV